MGTVYRARDPTLDRLVALKTISPGALSKDEAYQRFQREARAAAKLQHRNIVTIYELGEWHGTQFIAMELLEGMDLAQAMVPRDRLTVAQKTRIVIDACRGLDFAHKRGVVHRDVKPANIRVLEDGSVKIVDFGIAHVEDSTITNTGLVLGTPSYIAPDVLAGGVVDHRADVWALGVVMYELFAGRLPYDGSTVANVIYKIVHEPPPPLDAPGLGLPPGLATVVARALEKDPGRRYLDLAQLAADLEDVMGLRAAGEKPLLGPAREQAVTRDLLEAQKALADNDLERALAAARRARALDPLRPEIAGLVARLDDLLAEAPTVRRTGTSSVRPTEIGMTPLAADPQPTHAVAAPDASGAPARTTAVLARLRARGASVFRELATFGEPPATAGACLSPVRDLLATAGADGAVRVWDLRTRTRVLALRTEIHRRSGHDALALAMAFSSDGALLASGHVDGAVHLWNMATGEEVPVKLRHEASVGALAFAPDAATLATGGLDSNLKLWDVTAALAGEARRTLHRQPAAVTALAYTSDGASIATGHANRIVRVQAADSGRLQATLRGPEGAVCGLCLAPDGRRLAVVSHDRTIRIFDVAERQQVSVMAGQQRKPTSALSFFGDSRHLASVAQDNAVQLWDVDARATLAVLWGPAEEVYTGVALFGHGDHIAVALADGRVRVWVAES